MISIVTIEVDLAVDCVALFALVQDVHVCSDKNMENLILSQPDLPLYL